MGTYGDFGNCLILKSRAEKRGINVCIKTINDKDKIDLDGDIYLLGGGEDIAQKKVTQNLLNNNIFYKIVNNKNSQILAVCAGFQIIGKSYEVIFNNKVKTENGLNILPFITKRMKFRAVGETVSESKIFGTITGFENHGGGTFIDKSDINSNCVKNIETLGTIKKGTGNGFNQITEGFISSNIICTYMHGPVLARNPLIADYMLKKIVKKDLLPIDDSLINKMRNNILKN
jgi:CobQ-like glutamine amidotransferase family enzyme